MHTHSNLQKEKKEEEEGYQRLGASLTSFSLILCIRPIERFWFDLHAFQVIISFVLFPPPSPKPTWMPATVSEFASSGHFGSTLKLKWSVGKVNLSIVLLHEQHLNGSLGFSRWRTKCLIVASDALCGQVPAALSSFSLTVLTVLSRPRLHYVSFLSWMHQAPCPITQPQPVLLLLWLSQAPLMFFTWLHPIVPWSSPHWPPHLAACDSLP